jgi:ribosomal protein S20
LISSALDKAAKSRVIHRNNANRKKSRLAARLKTMAPVTAPAAKA